MTLHNGSKTGSVSFFRSTILPILIVSLFGLALFAVSARIWLPRIVDRIRGEQDGK